MKVLTVIGARPQFVKAAIVSRRISRRHDLSEVIVHTGQHYDHRMSQVFFDELGIPRPKHNLRVGSGAHGAQTGEMLAKIESVMLDEQPDAVLVYGDTNSTLAGTLAAAKLHIPVAHVESGLRSRNRSMPEEVNRVLTDHASTLLFCPTEEAAKNLAQEGIREGVSVVGDVMFDAATTFGEQADHAEKALPCDVFPAGAYALLTCHRAENTDDPRRLAAVVSAANGLSERLPVVFPMHPRTAGKLEHSALSLAEGVRTIEPLSYLQMLAAQRDAALVLTDSGGVQKEAFFLGTPCVTMREETEWVETVAVGANVLSGADEQRILQSANSQLDRLDPIPSASSHYGDGLATERILDRLTTFLARRANAA